jgi:beta-1,2-mannobiose phosphorylase / 1,2-beta-oligomannan phosphorylase
MFTRDPQNPLIKPADLKPSRPDFEVIGTFNAGVTLFRDEVLLLVRVAERPISDDADVVLCPHLLPDGELVIERIPRNSPDHDVSDPRLVLHRHTRELFLTSISHLRLARSHDGKIFKVQNQPWLPAQPPYSNFGTEDARITQLGDRYYINYTAVSRYGVATGLVSTTDFVTIQQHELMFPPANRDMTLFPEPINNLYVCYHRPMPGMFGGLHIWMATSPDMQHWGGHRVILEAKSGGWEDGRVGGGAPPIKTEQGWLSIYHAADRQHRYCLGAFLTPLDDPGRVIARTEQPIFMPEAPYEVDGFFGNVVFTCGAVLRDRTIWMYYGAADESIGVAQVSLDAVLGNLVSS